ncbi:hypothetical protein IQ07DRAFT_683495 [Pyrenochaeta sp. DS3sAY3a]|nr:hypothetical protein IQ07DRAFT_683495 [Pyrenochaeta sp. DS3sAY3a]
MWIPFLSTLALYLFPDDFDGRIFYEAISRTFVSIWMGDMTKLLAAPEPKAREAGGIISAFPWLQATTITEFSPPGTTFLPSGTSSSPPAVSTIRPITSGKSDVVVWAEKPINSAPKLVFSGYDLFIFSTVTVVLLRLVYVLCCCGVRRRSNKAALTQALLERAVEDRAIAQRELISSLGRQTQVTEDLAQKTSLLRAAKNADKAEQARILVLRQRIALDAIVAADQTQAIAAQERAIAAKDEAIESLRSEMEKATLGFQQVCEERDRLYRENDALTKAAEDLRGELSSLRATVEAERNAPRPEAKVVEAVKEVEEAGSVPEETVVNARSEDPVPAAAAAIASVTTSNGWLDASPLPPKGEDEVKFSSSRRKFRKDLVEAYEKQRNARGPIPQDVVVSLRLPCFDLYYRSLPIPKPLDKEPAIKFQDDKEVHTKCVHCDWWYTKEEFCNHLPVCNKFWESAVYCPQYDQVFAANAAFKARHAQDCRHKECPALRVLGLVP